jgi:hypothetical protein
MWTHLRRWIKFYEKALNRKLQGDDYIFPFIAPNGVFHPDRPISHEGVTKQLQAAAKDANLSGQQYSTHCLRRGGAQYRFMNAPLGKRWSLTACRWWGGWTEGEKVRTSYNTIAQQESNL